MVERARLENELGLKTYVGSNPTLPASCDSAPNQGRFFVHPQPSKALTIASHSSSSEVEAAGLLAR